MAKNIVNVVRVDWEDLTDVLAVEAKRAKFEKVARVETEKPIADPNGNARWARTNKVDDESIKAVFTGVRQEILLGLPYRARLAWILRLDEQHKAVRAES